MTTTQQRGEMMGPGVLMSEECCPMGLFLLSYGWWVMMKIFICPTLKVMNHVYQSEYAI
jgi:hypothetical protein